MIIKKAIKSENYIFTSESWFLYFKYKYKYLNLLYKKK